MKRIEGQKKFSGNNTHHKEDVVVFADEETPIQNMPRKQKIRTEITEPDVQESAFHQSVSVSNTGKSVLEKGHQKPGSVAGKNGGWIDL